MEGRHVRLEPLAVEHAEALHAALCGPGDADLWTYRATAVPSDVAATTALVQTMLSDPDVETFVAVPHGGAPSGMASYLRIEPAHGVVEVGAILWGRSMQGTAASTEAVHLLVAHAVDDLGYRRVEWKCDALNEPSRRAAARLGFSWEGRFRRHLVVKGRNRDTDWFSITDDEWPAVSAAHRAWLDEANFDAEGRQRVPLRPPAPAPPPG
jgi:RimJ/RimL family protein N-acetyltransferase